MTFADMRLLRSAALAFRDASQKDKLGDTKAAAAAAEKGIADRRKAVGYVDRPLAEQVLLQASRMARLGRAEEADRLFGEGLAAFEDLFGKVSRDRSAALQVKAMSRRGQDLAGAIGLQREAAEGYRKVLGEQEEPTSRSWQILASMYREQADRQNREGKVGESARSYRLEAEAHRVGGGPAWRSREALALAEQWRRFDALDAGERARCDAALDAAGNVNKPGGIAGAVHALETFDKSLGRGSNASLVLARRLASALAAAGGDAEKADAAFADLIARLDAERGRDDPVLNASIEEWAGLLTSRGDEREKADRPAEATALYARAVELLSTYLGREHHSTRSARCNLDRERILERSTREDRHAVLESFALMNRCGELTSAGRPVEALELARKALAARRRVLGTPSREVGFCLYAIGKLMEGTNRFADAETHDREALAQYTSVLGANHPDCAEVWTNLGKLSMVASRRDVARTAFQNANEAWKVSFGSEHPRYARGLVNLAAVPLAAHDAVESGRLLDEAVGILEKAGGEYRGDLARAYNGLAAISEGTGRLDDAEVLFRKAIAAWTEADLDVDRAISMDNLSLLLKNRGRLAEAEPLSAEAVAILEKKFGAGNSETIQAKGNRASILGQMGRPGEAAALLEQNLDASFALFEASSLAASERDRLMALLHRRTLLDAYLTFTIPAEGAPEGIYRRVVRWKAAVFGRQRTDRFARRSADLAREVTEARLAVRRLANLCLTIPEPDAVDAWQRSIREASARRDEAERALASAVRRRDAATSTENGASGSYAAPDLPRGAVFIDFFQYMKYSPDGEGGDEHVLAFVLRPDGPPTIADLGTSDSLARAVDDWRAATITRDPTPPRGDVIAPLRRLIVAPLASPLGDAKLVLTCPDGPLTRMPLAALPHPTTGRPLIETTLFVTVPHVSQIPGRTILASWIEPTAASPSATERPRGVPSLLSIGSLAYGPPAKRGFSFRPLTNAGRELEAVGASFETAFGVKAPAPLTAESATESAVNSALPGKEVVHLATHGFLVPEVQLAQLMRADEHIARQLAIGQGGAPREWRAASLLGNGVLSGIALSLANGTRAPGPEGGEDDNLLAAAEVALLDLNATRLAVLSACETGVGDVADAEAVLGLQRAFHVAGAEAVMASLWKVDDAATARLMGSFYRWLWARGVSPPVALRRAQLELLAGPVSGDGSVRDPDFAAKTPAATTPGPAAPADKTRLWAAFTISYCRDDSGGKQGNP